MYVALMAQTRAFLATIFAKDVVTVIDSFFDKYDDNDKYTGKYGYYEDCMKISSLIDGIYGACYLDCIEVVNTLISKLKPDVFRDTVVIHAAYFNGRIEMINCIEAAFGTNWDKALSGACYGGHIHLVEKAIQNGANKWNVGLYYAARGGHIQTIIKMVKHGADDWGWALVGAAKGGHVALVEFLLGLYFSHTYIDHALSRACHHGHIEIARLLIKHGANLDNITIQDAANSYSMVIVNMIWNDHDLDRWLKIAIEWCWHELAERALVAGATNFTAALKLACQFNMPKIAIQLIARGARGYEAATVSALLCKNYDLAEFMQKKCREAYESGQIHLLYAQDD